MKNAPDSPLPLAPVTPRVPAVSSGGATLELLEAEAPYDAPQTGARRTFSLRALWRYHWMMVVIFLALGVPLAAASWLLIVPEYEAAALAEVRSLVPRWILPSDETGPIPRYDQYLRSQVELIRAEVLPQILADPDVKQTEWYQAPPGRFAWLTGGTTDRIVQLARITEVEPLPGTELIRMAARARGPRDAQTIANAILRNYDTFVRSRTSDKDKELLEKIGREETEVKVDINVLERRIRSLQDALQTSSPEELMARRRLWLEENETELGRLEADLRAIEDQIRTLEPNETVVVAEPDAPDNQARYTLDPTWLDLAAHVRSAELRLANLREQFGARHPAVLEGERGVSVAQEAQKVREQQLDQLQSHGVLPQKTGPDGGKAAVLSLPELRHQKLQFGARKARLQEYVDRLRDNFGKSYDTAKELAGYKDELTQKTDWLRAIERRKRELQGKVEVDTRIASTSEATLPSEPANDKRLRYSLASLAAAAAAALAAAYLRLTYSPEVQEIDEVRAPRGAFVGRAPLGRGLSSAELERCPFQAEAMRLIRTALLTRLTGTGHNVVQITSSVAGAGKSTLAFLLARSLAQCGKRVLLVDADVRRPALAARFAIESSPGLLNLLALRDSEASGIRPTAIPNLSVLPAGVCQRAEDVELLANGAFTALLGRWREQYDLILLDTPPLLGAADAAILSRHADGTLLVVRERHCRRAGVVEALAVLSAAGGKLLGTVFIGSDHQSGYGYGYGNGYAYAGQYAASPVQAVAEAGQTADGAEERA